MIDLTVLAAGAGAYTIAEPLGDFEINVVYKILGLLPREWIKDYKTRKIIADIITVLGVGLLTALIYLLLTRLEIF